LFPVAVLVGTIVALVQMAARSELTIFRASGASTAQMLGALFKIAMPMVIASFICGELLSPPVSAWRRNCVLRRLIHRFPCRRSAQVYG